jgi:hypothetical protein
MAKKTTTTKSLDSDVAKELEKALDIDLTSEAGGDLDIAASMEDLEAQISQAADELARAGRTVPPAPANMSAADSKPFGTTGHLNLRPADPRVEMKPAPQARNDAARTGAQPPPFSPANDDRQKDYRSLLHSLNRRASNTIYWVVAVISVAWIAGAAALANMIFGPTVWRVRTLDQLLARPELIGVAVAAFVPVVLFWAFAAMVRRAQDMRIAAQSMTEVASA